MRGSFGDGCQETVVEVKLLHVADDASRLIRHVRVGPLHPHGVLPTDWAGRCPEFIAGVVSAAGQATAMTPVAWRVSRRVVSSVGSSQMMLPVGAGVSAQGL